MSKTSGCRLSEEQLLKAVEKKRECNAKAQSIVESFLEKDVEEKYFLAMLKDINQSHYEDVVEERYILTLCGYPLCSTQLQKICRQKVHQVGSHYCQACAYKKAICAMCGKKLLDTKNYRQSSA